MSYFELYLIYSTVGYFNIHTDLIKILFIWQVDEIREMVDNDLGFQQAPLMCYSRTKTLLFISNDKKVVGCLIAEHIQWVSDFFF